jgi:predicted Rdx family selenoprotein
MCRWWLRTLVAWMSVGMLLTFVLIVLAVAARSEPQGGGVTIPDWPGYQPYQQQQQDREGARPRHARDAARPRRRGD